MSSLHLSYTKELQIAIGKCQEMTESFLTITNPTTLTGATNIAKTIMKTINPIFEKKTGQNFTSVISRSLNLTPKLSYKVKRKQNKENLQNSNEKCYFARWCGCPLLLCSGKSFIQHGRDRLATGFTTREETTVREKTHNEKNKRLKNKKHHGPFNSYNINKEALENKLASMSLNRPINWTRLE